MEEKLIEMVSERKYLYDKNNKYYRDMNTKEAAWKEIASHFGLKPETVKTKWVSLRDMYMRDLRKQNKLALSGSTATFTKCKHFDRLHFLKDMYKPRKSNTNLEVEFHALCTDILSDESFDIPGEIVTYEPATPEPSLTFEEASPAAAVVATAPLTTTRRKSVKQAPPQSLSLGKSSVGEEMLKMIKDIRGEQAKQDDISMFAVNLEDLIRQANFSIAERVEIQIKILNLVQEYINKRLQK